MAVSMAEPPPTATIACQGPPSRAKAMASSSDSSVGSTRARSKIVTSRPRSATWAAIRAGCPVAATPGSVTSSTRGRLADGPDQLLQVVADLGRRAAAELQTRGCVGEDGLVTPATVTIGAPSSATGCLTQVHVLQAMSSDDVSGSLRPSYSCA